MASDPEGQLSDQSDIPANSEKSIMNHGFPGIPGSNGMPGVPGMPGPQGLQGREGTKGKTGAKGTKGMMGPKGERGREGLHGKSGSPGVMGMKGDPGSVGPVGRKGDKGEKGESVKGSSAGPVPQTNWKQCVWKRFSGTDNGKIKDCSFNKLLSDTALKVSFQGNMRVGSTGVKCNRWYFKFNNKECSGPMTVEALVYNSMEKYHNLLHHRSFEGLCENIPQGAVRVELWIGPCSGGHTLGDAETGWNSVSRIMIEEVSRRQS